MRARPIIVVLAPNDPEFAMRRTLSSKFVQRLYQRHHSARIAPCYLNWRTINAPDGHPLAVLGYRPASSGPLFLERYLDGRVEDAVSDTLGIAVERTAIVEIGCLAATPSPALVRLWHGSALALNEQFSVTVATLNAPLRRAFDRVGLPFVKVAPATRERAGGGDWGRYYDSDPVVCAGLISEGADALNRYAVRLEHGA